MSLPVPLKQGPEVRQIRRLLDNGRQLPLVTTHFRMPMEQVAGPLFSRWSQENFFKYMRQEFNLDALAVHGLEMQDPEARVVNPRWRALDRSVQRLRQRLGTLRNRIAVQSLILSVVESQVDCRSIVAYRAETRMMPAVAQAQGKSQRPRRHLRALLQAAADIFREPDNGILRIRILGTASDAGDNAIAALLQELDQTNTIFPGTSLRMVYELPQKIGPIRSLRVHEYEPTTGTRSGSVTLDAGSRSPASSRIREALPRSPGTISGATSSRSIAPTSGLV